MFVQVDFGPRDITPTDAPSPAMAGPPESPAHGPRSAIHSPSVVRDPEAPTLATSSPSRARRTPLSSSGAGLEEPYPMPTKLSALTGGDATRSAIGVIVVSGTASRRSARSLPQSVVPVESGSTSTSAIASGFDVGSSSASA